MRETQLVTLKCLLETQETAGILSRNGTAQRCHFWNLVLTCWWCKWQAAFLSLPSVLITSEGIIYIPCDVDTANRAITQARQCPTTPFTQSSTWATTETTNTHISGLIIHLLSCNWARQMPWTPSSSHNIPAKISLVGHPSTVSVIAGEFSERHPPHIAAGPQLG